MRIPRLFIPEVLQAHSRTLLPRDTAHYVFNVLRLRSGASVRVFNGDGGEFSGQIEAVGKKDAELVLGEFHPIETESPLQLTLVQAVSRPEHMDFTLQKSVELGVQKIVPVLSERSPPLSAERQAKRQQHWQGILTSACEQCGRNRVPQLEALTSLEAWLSLPLQGMGLVLAPTASQRFADLVKPTGEVQLLIGAEGGLSERELVFALEAGYQGIVLGKRILRTETAAVATLAICQAFWGDLA